MCPTTTFAPRPLLCFCLPLFALATLLAVPARGEGPFYLNEKALAKFDFEGMELPQNARQLKAQFPTAELDKDRVAGAAGLECYVLRDVKNADLARFYFCDDRFYQLEIGYKEARVEKLGGMSSVVQKLVDLWGPADHVGESRWTWQRPMYMRRADFYTRPDGGQLTLTDMALMPSVNQRLSRAEPPTIKLGF
jgi:hypothetical protein